MLRVTFLDFLRLIIPYWAQLWHRGGVVEGDEGGWHKSSDGCCWAGADPGESSSFLVSFFSPHASFILALIPSASSSDLLQPFH